MNDLIEWLSIFREQMKQVTLLEGIGVLFGIMQVLYAKNNKVWLYPCGIISVIITAFIFFESKLYAEILLQLYYLVMSIYGWILWSRKVGEEELLVSYSTEKEWKVAVVIIVASYSILYVFLKYITDSDVPIWDSIVTAFAWAGMWLLAKRKIENWIFLNISNFIAIPLLIHKGLILYSLLTIFLFVVAVFGYIDWRKIINKQNT